MDQALSYKEASGLLYEYTHLRIRWEDARALLRQHIISLLEGDLPALYQLLYKVDVDEMKAKAAFGYDVGTIADNLVALIMDRVLQKAETRLKYRT